MKTRRAFLVEPGRFEISEVEASPGVGQVLVKVSGCGLCNWELNHWKGYLGKCPQPLGHEWAGKVVEVGDEVEGLKVGDTVTGFALGMTGFSDYLVADAAKCVKLAPSVDPKHALGEPLKCIITVLRGAAPEAGDIGVVVGCGPMGLWCIQALAGNLLSALIAVDIDDSKLKMAKEFGATHTINPKERDAREEIRKISKGHMADFVIEGTGSPAVLNTCMNYLRDGRGRLVLMSSHEESAGNFNLRPAIRKSLELRVTHPLYSQDEMDDLRRAVNLLNNGVFKMDKIISHVFTLEDIQRAFETLENKPADFLKGIVVPE